MVFRAYELMYNDKLVGYRCHIKNKKRRDIADIDIKGYEYIRKVFGELYIEKSREGLSRVVFIPESCFEVFKKDSTHNLEAVIKEIQREIKNDLICIESNKELCKELKTQFDIYNTKYFNSKLPSTMLITVSSRFTTTAGRFSYDLTRPYTNKITISTLYIENKPEDILDTLLHEMIHAYLHQLGYYKENHGTLFKQEMARINSYGHNITIYVEESFNRRRYKFAMVCKKCGNVSKCIRSLKYNIEAYRCSKCKGKIELVDKGYFYGVYRCNFCKELFFEDDIDMADKQQNCPYCNRVLEII